MTSFEPTYNAATAAVVVVTVPPASMTIVSHLASTRSDTIPTEAQSSTPAPEFSKPLSPNAIGLLLGLGVCGILGFVIWGIIYFRCFKPTKFGLSEPAEEGEAGYHHEVMTEQNADRNHQTMDATWGGFLRNASGTTTARPSTEGSVYPSVGTMVNTALEREILEILETEVAMIGRVRGLGFGLGRGEGGW